MKNALLYNDYCILKNKSVKSKYMKLYIRLNQLLLEKSEREKKVYHIKDIAPLFPEITYDGVRKWFVGHSEPKLEYIVRLAKFFGVTTDRILGEEHQGLEQHEDFCRDLLNKLKELDPDKQKDLIETFTVLTDKALEKSRVGKKKSDGENRHASAG